MENKLYLYGASGHGKVIVDILKSNNETIEAILDDFSKLKILFGIPVLNSKDIDDLSGQKLIVSIGDNLIRKKVVQGLNNVAFHIAIHPKAVLSSFSEIGEGTVVMAGAIVNPDTMIGKHCIINTGVIIEHDCVIRDYVHISPNTALAGAVTIHEGAHIGIGVSVIQGITIGQWAIVGAGAVIIEDVPDFAVVVGNPGKVIKIKENKSNE
jgi:sugar O-acyltransferase (sialic acid O-acetyltransferase NeuD family)